MIGEIWIKKDAIDELQSIKVEKEVIWWYSSDSKDKHYYLWWRNFVYKWNDINKEWIERKRNNDYKREAAPKCMIKRIWRIKILKEFGI